MFLNLTRKDGHEILIPVSAISMVAVTNGETHVFLNDDSDIIVKQSLLNIEAATRDNWYYLLNNLLLNTPITVRT